jgi:hypothetical protein
MMNEKKKRLLKYSLGALQAFIGISAIAGGFRLVSNPNGTLDITIEWLSNSPFTNYLIPGLVLLAVIGFGNVLAGVASFLNKRYAGGLAAILGTFLILFMTIEVWFIGLRNFLQPLYFILGAVVLILGLKLFKLYITVPIGLESKTNKLSV